jgi:hypothetical protein
MKRLYQLINTENEYVEREEYLTEDEAAAHNNTLKQLREPYRWVPYEEDHNHLVHC